MLLAPGECSEWRLVALLPTQAVIDWPLGAVGVKSG